MNKPLQSLANIRTGVFAKPIAQGEVVYLQSRHFDEGGRLIDHLHPDLMGYSFSEKHLLMAGDVLFAAKGTKNFAAVFESGNPPSVASTSFFVLSLKGTVVLPSYLAWYLNHPNTQALLKGEAKGTAIVSISKNSLSELDIPVPAIEIQQLVLKIADLRKVEMSLKQRIERLKEKQLQQLIINAIN
ncbi:MAG: restriction endonuclease subunit S [Imperialibacter sp.]|uniref:restriction endonuclease subunit S n=1 Tax=Imperialibacter sp. TaxID=2038411 RepID=UPI0032EAB5EC